MATLFVLSVALNTALALALLSPSHRSPGPTPPVAWEPNSPKPTLALDAAPPRRSPSPPAGEPPLPWPELASEDLSVFAERLRAVGCPEPTVRDILLPELHRRQHARTRARDWDASVPFWLGGQARGEHARALAAAERQAAADHREEVRQLFGLDVCPCDQPSWSDPAQYEERALVRLLLGPLPEPIFEQVTSILHRYETLGDELDEATDGIELPSDQALRQQWVAECRRDLAATLTPEQFKELQARLTSIDLFDSDELRFVGVEVRPEEVRALYVAQAQTLKDPLAGLLDVPTAREQDESQAVSAFEAAARALLGEERFVAFQRAQDPAFRQLWSLTESDGLTPTTAERLYAYRLEIEQTVSLWRAQNDLNNGSQPDPWPGWQAAVQAEVQRCLGPEAYQHYLERGGGWVTNLHHL